MKSRISQRADDDIVAICDFIAKDNPDAANRLDQRIHDAIGLLTRFPGLVHRRSDVRNPAYRFWSVGIYLIAYRVARSQLIVVRVVHGARNLKKIFK